MLLAGLGTADIKMFVYGSEFAKGSNWKLDNLSKPMLPHNFFTQFSNNQLSLKDYFEVSMVLIQLKLVG